MAKKHKNEKNTDTENFESGYVYHIYTHANGKDLIFREEENYRYFLEKILKYIIPVAEIYAYCLIPNHFHLLLRFKELKQIENEHFYLMKQFSNLLNGYAKAYNKRYNRKGSLFLDYLRRKRVSDEKYLNHGLVKDIRNWRYSSYRSYINTAKTSHIERAEMMKYFDTVNDFIMYYQSNIEYDCIQTS